MSEQDSELEAFSKFIVALEPWLGEVVLVGGWAHRLYRLDPRARKLDYLPLTTLDGDVRTHLPMTLRILKLLCETKRPAVSLLGGFAPVGLCINYE